MLALQGMPPLSPEKPALCAGCGGKISDRYYLLAVDKQWHLRCLKCCECKLALESELTCFAKDGSIYCKEDYYRYSHPAGPCVPWRGPCANPGGPHLPSAPHLSPLRGTVIGQETRDVRSHTFTLRPQRGQGRWWVARPPGHREPRALRWPPAALGGNGENPGKGNECVAGLREESGIFPFAANWASSAP